MVAFLIIGGLLFTLAVGIGTVTSGWADLQSKFPDRVARPLRTFLFRSATISDGWKFGFSFGGVIMFQVCRDGLRVGMTAPFSLFAGPFFVPWEEISLEPAPLLFPRTNIVFGRPMVGVARVSAGLAQKIALSRQTPVTLAP